MPRKNSKLTLKDISLCDQETMGLGWAWKAGAAVTYVRPYGFDWHDGKHMPCSLVIHHVKNERRELWVFDMFLKATCLWDS